MTNEEKAREIAECNDGHINIISFESAKIMAEWKDKQFREYLEKNMKEQSDNLSDHPSYPEMIECTIAKAIYQKIITELFSK